MTFRFKIELAERQGFDVSVLRDLSVSHDETDLVIEQDDPRWLAVLATRRAKTKPTWPALPKQHIDPNYDPTLRHHRDAGRCCS